MKNSSKFCFINFRAFNGLTFKNPGFLGRKSDHNLPERSRDAASNGGSRSRDKWGGSQIMNSQRGSEIPASNGGSRIHDSQGGSRLQDSQGVADKN